MKKIKTEKREEMLYAAAELFKVFGDATRLKILYELSLGEMCVSELSLAVNMSSSAVSHQLKILRQVNLVKFRRDGKTVYYSLSDDHVTTVLGQGMEHVGHTLKI